MNTLGLSPEALEQRRKFIQGSDALAIVEGRWRDLWLQKTGRAQDADLSNELRVQLGSFTEPFNLAWCAKQTGRSVIYFSGNPLMREIWRSLTGWTADANEHVVHDTVPYLAANLDALSCNRDGHRMYLDAKWLSRADEKEILRYTPQGTHCALVTGCDWWGLSIIAGGRWELVEQEVDPFFAAEYLAKCEEFWGYVTRDEEPEDRVEIARPKPVPVLRSIKLDDEFREAWGQFNWAPEAIKAIRTFVETEGAHRAHMASRDDINAVVPTDVGELTRGRYKRKVAKDGSIRMTVEPMKGDNNG